MSNIYMQKPATKGKVVMKTTVGDVELELWAKETPKACRNFIQLCMEGYLNDTTFHGIIKGFITQGGNLTGTGEGGKIYGQPFKNLFHARLRFCRRDLIAMANAGEDDNGFQFFFTLISTPDLQHKHTIFGKVKEYTIYNMLKHEEALVDEDDKSLYPPRLVKTMILNNPFSDIMRRIIVQESEEVKDSLQTKTATVKDFNILSFGEEAEEAKEEFVILYKKFRATDKSAHSHLMDPKLSSQPAVEPHGLANKKREEDRSSNWESDDEVKTQEELEIIKREKKAVEERIRNKLRDAEKEPKKIKNYKDDAEDDKDKKENK
ncbi:PREDICTED: LOW QUALITY PROTEIN: peptidyl-prolyl cis-trans isomerase CWC27 homolog [Eufriesea mexicana]|uniref:LOW QUALITY PROTEIN: peptidyl-prolyl cis-trans isomerase CWC27 homolog n=1 Tax=Eufriesea mexicana TaxID=516756 RepID=UPI00083C2212|nr:PREDICTED: LOW QUALITY PROTEIN: peptidyl-prolyl cis-trans isomerase CWC27 homolog [Eufriesea mexicana]